MANDGYVKKANPDVAAASDHRVMEILDDFPVKSFDEALKSRTHPTNDNSACFTNQRITIDSLESENRDLRKDKARLDYLSVRHAEIDPDGLTLRESVDLLMRKGGGDHLNHLLRDPIDGFGGDDE